MFRSLLLLLAIAPLARAIDYPKTRPAQAAAAWVEAYAAGEEALREWVLAWRDKASLARTSVDEQMARYAQLRQMAGELQVDRILDSDSRQIMLLLRDAEGSAWFRAVFQIEDGVPFKVAEFHFAPEAAPEDAGSPFQDLADPSELARKARELARAPAVALALFERGELRAQAADGVIAAGDTIAVRPDMPFHIGSISKSFTGTLIARLVEREQLRWQDTLGELLPDIPMREEYRSVTIAQLLRHRGAIPPYTFINAFVASELEKLGPEPVKARAAFAARVLQENPSGEVDAAMVYSNAGYSLLGHIAERIDGRPWEAQLRAEIFAPLGMDSAGLGWAADLEHPQLPRGHYLEPAGLRPQPLDDHYQVGSCLAPSGDLHCNAADLARYGAEHLRGLRGEDGLLRAATMQALHDPGSYEQAVYAGGWVIDEDGRQWHNGTVGTFYALLKLDVERDRAAAVLFSSMSPVVQSTAMGLADALLALP